MGEIMRWRLTRAPQRRVPSKESVIRLNDTHKLKVSTKTRLLNLPKHTQQPQSPKKKVISPYIAYLGILQDSNALRLGLTTGSPAGPSPISALLQKAAIGLLQLDEWLAANAPVSPATPPYATPSVTDLQHEIGNDLGAYPPNSAAWKGLGEALTELFYAGLILSAMGGYISFVDSLGLITRWLLVFDLVNDTLTTGNIVSPDDIYVALRWRTIILPDDIASTLLTIRSNKRAVLVRKPGFADLFITREEWDHYEAAEIASIENILGRELKSRVHVLVNQTKTTTTTDRTTTTLTEQDNTTTDLNQLQQQATSNISIAAHVDGQVNVSVYNTGPLKSTLTLVARSIFHPPARAQRLRSSRTKP